LDFTVLRVFEAKNDLKTRGLEEFSFCDLLQQPVMPMISIHILHEVRGHLTDYSVFSPEITMARVNLSGMSVEALMDLRKRVDEMLHRRRAELEKQLERIAVVGGRRVVRGGASVLKGKKVPPKYRGPSGETWAGRGARPRWLVAAIKGGKKLEDFLIDKGRRKRRSKR
jgi:DNA-binding protein H-NS